MQKQNNKSNSALLKNSYKEEWKQTEKKKSKPKNFSKVVTVDYKEFIDKIFSQNSAFVKSTIEERNSSVNIVTSSSFLDSCFIGFGLLFIFI